MEVHLTQNLEAFIARSVQSGRFSSPDELPRRAVELLERHEAELQTTCLFVKDGPADLDAGDFEDFTEENLRDLFDGIENRGRMRLAADRRP